MVAEPTLPKLSVFVDEQRRMSLFPGIAFRDTDWDRRAWVTETAFDVWQIVEAYQDIGSVKRMTGDGLATEHQILLALAYYKQFPDEIDQAIAENRRPIKQLEREFPLIAVSRG